MLPHHHPLHSTTPSEPLGTRTRCNGQLAYVAMTPPGTRAISTGIQGQPGGQYRRLCSTEADDSGVKACLLRIHWFALWHLIMQCSYPCPREPFLHFLSFFHFFFHFLFFHFLSFFHFLFCLYFLLFFVSVTYFFISVTFFSVTFFLRFLFSSFPFPRLFFPSFLHFFFFLFPFHFPFMARQVATHGCASDRGRLGTPGLIDP